MKDWLEALRDWLDTYAPELLALAALILGVMIWLMGGFGCTAKILPRPPVEKPTTEMAPDTSREHARVETANEEVARLKGELAQAEARADNARAAEREARLAGVRRLVAWSTAIFVLVGILSVGAAIFLKMTSLFLLTGACAGMAGAAMASNLLLDHPLVAGGGTIVVVAGVVGLIFWRQHHTENGLQAAVKVVDLLKPHPALESEGEREARRFKQTKVVTSAGAGAFQAIERARDKIKKQVEQAARKMKPT